MHPRDHEHTAIDSLYKISSLLSDTEEPKVALQLILDEIVRVFKPSSASILLINPDSKALELEASHNLPDDWHDIGLKLGQGITGWTALHGQPLIVNDVRVEPRYISIRPSIRAEMAMPMEDQGTVIGVVNVDSEEVNAYDESSLKVLTLLTNEATRVISRIWLIKQLRSKANHLESLVAMSQQLAGEIDNDSIMHSLSKQALQLMDCDGSAIFSLNAKQDELHLQSFVSNAGIINSQAVLHLDHSALGSAVYRNKLVEVYDLNFTEENDFLPALQRQGYTSMLASPILFGDEILGVIIVYTKNYHRFNNEEKMVFKTLAEMGAIALQNAHLYARIFASEESLRRNEKLTTLGMLAAEIAHEIRNPLTVIKLLFGSLDLQFKNDDPRHTDLSVIAEKLEQLEEIVERVLNFGRTREGAHTLQDLNLLVEDTFKLMRLKLHQQKINLEFQPTKDSFLVNVNKGQILQVLLNLLLNATQAMPDGGKILIEASSNDQFAYLKISDSGRGIPVEIQEEIFDSFLTNRPDGTGLGLSISKQILRSHSGNIELAGSSANGTTFRLWLPLT